MSAESTSSAGPAELVAGFLSVVSMVGSALAIFWEPLKVSPFAVVIALIAVGMSPRGARLPFLAVFWDPIRVSPFAIILALISAAMAPRDSRLPLIAVVVGALAFIVGATLAVTTNNPLY